jgi:hypothetical protein
MQAFNGSYAVILTLHVTLKADRCLFHLTQLKIPSNDL